MMFRGAATALITAVLVFSTSAEFYTKSKLKKNFAGFWGNDESSNIIPSGQSSHFGTWNSDSNFGRGTALNPFGNVKPSPAGSEKKKLVSWSSDERRPSQENIYFSKDDDMSTGGENAYGNGLSSFSYWDMNAGNNNKIPGDDKWASDSFVPHQNEKKTTTSRPSTRSNFQIYNLDYDFERDGKTKNQKNKSWNPNTNFGTTVKKATGALWSAKSFTTPGYVGVESGKWNPTQNDQPKKNGNNGGPTTTKGWKSATTIRPGGRSTTSMKKKTTEKPVRNGNSPSSFKDLTILDDLDKNEWYFGKESDFPVIDANSNLNIDVKKLWDFDKRSSPEKSNNQRRRNREANKHAPCKCVNVDLCSEEDVMRNFNEWNCEKLTDVCCSKSTAEAGQEEEEKLAPLTCGRRRVTKEPSRTGTGTETKQQNSSNNEEFPWVLNLGTLNQELNCSASLIQPQLALTAAHCVTRTGGEHLLVKSGAPSVEASSQVRKVIRIIVHPNHDERNPRNDVALLVLQKPFDFDGRVNTICLPGTNDKWDSSNCVVAAWTRDKSWLKIKKGIVRFLPQSSCQSIMTDERHEYVLHDSFACGVEKNGHNLCSGFEGSPIVCPSITFPDSHVQIGLVSKDANCDYFGEPILFTNIIKFIEWTNEMALDLDLFDVARVQNLN